MIKKIKVIFETYMIRPMIYQSVSRFMLALVLCLLWDRFLNKDKLLHMTESAFFVAALVFFLAAWIHYLRLDGIRLKGLFGAKENKKKQKSHTRDIVDFADEKIISFAELDDEERIVCRLLGNLLCAGIYLVISVVAVIF